MTHKTYFWKDKLNSPKLYDSRIGLKNSIWMNFDMSYEEQWNSKQCFKVWVLDKNIAYFSNVNLASLNRLTKLKIIKV